MRPEPRTWRPYQFDPPKRTQHGAPLSPQSPAPSSPLSSNSPSLPVTVGGRSVPKGRHVPVLAPMRRLDYQSEGEAELDDIKEESEDEDEGDDDEGDHRMATGHPSVTPLRELTPSTESEELADQDDEYVPLSSIRSRGIGRLVTKSPRKTAAKQPPSKLARPASKQVNPPSVTTGGTKNTSAKKAGKGGRVGAGERRMSQNRSYVLTAMPISTRMLTFHSAQKKYRDKNRRLADLVSYRMHGELTQAPRVQPRDCGSRPKLEGQQGHGGCCDAAAFRGLERVPQRGQR